METPVTMDFEVEEQEESVLEPLWDGFQYFEHQVEGVRWMLEREKCGVEVNHKKKGTVTVRGGLQCDEMGLGKTIQVVGTMVNHLVPVTVLLAPLAMIETWTGVCLRAGFRVFQAAGCQWFQAGAGQGQGRQRSEAVYLTNFEKLYTTPRLFRSLTADRIVLDEAHKIRNPDGQMAIYARRLAAPLRWAVTGTPLVNEWRDVVSLLAFLGVPCSPLWRWEDHLTEALPHLVLHRSLEGLRGVLSDAPPYPLIEHMKLPFLSEKEREFYLGVQSAEMASPEDHLTSQEAFLLILRLRQISVHPQVYIQAKRREKRSYPRPDWDAPSTKLVALREILMRDEWVAPLNGEAPHKYIIFCQFKEEMELIHEYLDSLDLFAPPNILEYDGSLTQEQRERVLTHSKKATEPTVLLLQLQAGGVGLNLQECDRIIFMSPWWTSALMDQAIARAVRMGQQRMVRVYHLELEAEETEQNTIFIDHMIDQKAEEKRGMLRDLFALCEALKAQWEGTGEVEEEEVEVEEEEEEEQEEEEEEEEPGQA